MCHFGDITLGATNEGSTPSNGVVGFDFSFRRRQLGSFMNTVHYR